MINLISLCKDANRIGISGHIKPDGDCLGSTLGLWQFLSNVYPEKKIHVFLEKPGDEYLFIKGADKIVDITDIDDVSILSKKICSVDKTSDVSLNESFDVFIVADSVPEKDRIGVAYDLFENAKIKVNIDHHITNPGVGDAIYVDPKASSASELVFDLIELADANLEYVDVDLAETIYLGIIQDCGVFQYSNTSPKTLQIAAKLIGYGFDFPKLIEETFYEKTFVQNKVLGMTLDKAELFLDGLVCASIMTLADMESLGATGRDFEGVVNQLRHTKGADVAILCREDKNGKYKVSMRSGGIIDVSKVASVFGGGGHVRASGCTIEPDNCIEILCDEIAKQI